MIKLLNILIAIIALTFQAAISQPLQIVSGRVKYISQDSYYIDIGTNSGLSIGDTLTVFRNNRQIAQLVVQHIAGSSSACTLLNQTDSIQINDLVRTRVAGNKEAQIDVTVPEQVTSDSSKFKSSTKTAARRTKKTKSNNVTGRIGLQSVLFRDRTGSGSDYNQFAIHARLKVKQIMGTPFEFRYRSRSRAHDRESTFSPLVSESDWTHCVYELGLFYASSTSPYELGFGRVLSNKIRGLGYIDGGLFSYKMNENLSVGLAGGSEPQLSSSALQTNNSKFGLFLNFETKGEQNPRLSSTLAFSGSYKKTHIDREFFYLQNSYLSGTKFSVYQTVEVDLNRGWKSSAGNSFQLSNFFISTRCNPLKFLSVDVSYDVRKLVRLYETRSIPDSLFDEATRQGLRAGFSLDLPYRTRVFGSFGIRFRNGDLQNTTSFSGGFSIRQILNSNLSLHTQISYFSTMFTEGYRPTVQLRLPVSRKLSADLGAGGYIYQIGQQTTSSYFLDGSANYRLSRLLYVTVGNRMFIDKNLKSNRIFLEGGVTF